MNEDLELKGEWFLPSDKDNRLSGILHFDNTGGTLELFGQFPLTKDQLFDPDIILGVTTDSKHITIYKAYVLSYGGMSLRTGNEIGKPLTKYGISYIFVGVHIEDVNDLCFNDASVNLHNLQEWLFTSGFVRDNEDYNLYNITYEFPEPIHFKIDNNWNGEFRFHAYRNSSRFKIDISQNSSLFLSSNTEQSFEKILEIIYIFQMFLIMGLYSKTFPLAIKLYNKKFMREFGDQETAVREIDLYFHFRTSRENNKIIRNDQMLFNFEAIKNKFSLLITNWYKAYKNLDPVFNIVLDQFYDLNKFSENTFLNLAQAAETFHARTNNYKRISEEEYKAMKIEILGLVPQKYHVWLEEKFKFGNEPHLQERLCGILKKYSNSFLDNIIGDKDDFAKRIKQSRNYYTHYSIRKKIKS